MLLDCGPGVLSRLRTEAAWPELDAIAISHFHLDHWGDLVPWVWGAIYGPGRELPPLALHLPPGGRTYLASLAGQFGGGPTCSSRAFEIHEYRVGVPNEIAGFELVPVQVQHYSDRHVRLPRLATAAPRSRTRPTPRRTAASSSWPATPISSSARRRSTVWEPEPRGHLSLAEAESAFAASGAQAAADHAPPAGAAGRRRRRARLRRARARGLVAVGAQRSASAASTFDLDRRRLAHQLAEARGR